MERSFFLEARSCGFIYTVIPNQDFPAVTPDIKQNVEYSETSEENSGKWSDLLDNMKLGG